MAQETKLFSNQEILKMLIKQAEIKEGIWMLSVNFGGAATNVINEIDGNAAPAFIVTVQSIGLARVDELSPLAIDAATVWE